MPVNRVVLVFFCFTFFIIGMLTGAVFIDVEEKEPSFPEYFFAYRPCEDFLLDCYSSLREYAIDKNESQNYIVDLA